MEQQVEQSGGGAYTLRRPAAAAFLTGQGYPIKTATLAQYAVTGGGPRLRKFGRIVLYSQDDLLAWARGRSRVVTSTSELAA